MMKALNTICIAICVSMICSCTKASKHDDEKQAVYWVRFEGDEKPVMYLSVENGTGIGLTAVADRNQNGFKIDNDAEHIGTVILTRLENNWALVVTGNIQLHLDHKKTQWSLKYGNNDLRVISQKESENGVLVEKMK